MKDVFMQDVAERTKRCKKMESMENLAGVGKLILLVLLLGNLWMIYVQHEDILWLVVFAVLVVVFLLVCVFHNRVVEELHYEKGMIAISETNEKRVNGQWHDFPDVGEEWEDYEHPFAMDLDVVGKNSLFQMLNSTHTIYGRRHFAKDLMEPAYTKDEIIKRQEAIRELGEDYEWSARVEHYFSTMGLDERLPKVVEQLKNREYFFTGKVFPILFRISWIPTCISTLCLLFLHNAPALIVASGFYVFHFVAWILGFVKVRAYLGVMRSAPRRMLRYNRVLRLIEEREFQSEYLQERKEMLRGGRLAMEEMMSIFNHMKRTQNGLLCFLLNLLFLWDYQSVMKLQGWRERYSEQVEEWFLILGEWESLLSFANLPRVCDHVVLPQICNEANRIEAKTLGHPLIGNTVRVCNDFSLNQNVYIISGSNMSGKTTFMRTVGVNMVLAQAGSYVCADEMKASEMHLMTSMRIADNLGEGISTFYAELKRIKRIVDRAKEDTRTMFLIDEIFRGTNSVDRLKGAEGVLRELSGAGVVGMITTHDLEVCKLEKECPNIHNINFQEQYQGDEIYFDYRLRQGTSHTTNAAFLLRKIGIIKE